MTAPSKSQIRKAGSTLRAYTRGHATSDQHAAALRIITLYRASFATPLSKVNSGLRSFLSTLDIKGEVSQRLKRMDTIVEKLTIRETGLDLTRMGDIGGCRIVTDKNNIADLYRIREWIVRRWGDSIERESDYITHPRSSGYRALHLIVRRDDRLIEIQLRTQRMHHWAQLIESLSQHAGANFKQDGGSDPASNFARMLSLAFQHLDGTRAMSNTEAAQLRETEEQLLRLVEVEAFKRR